MRSAKALPPPHLPSMAVEHKHLLCQEHSEIMRLPCAGLRDDDMLHRSVRSVAANRIPSNSEAQLVFSSWRAAFEKRSSVAGKDIRAVEMARPGAIGNSVLARYAHRWHRDQPYGRSERNRASYIRHADADLPAGLLFGAPVEPVSFPLRMAKRRKRRGARSLGRQDRGSSMVRCHARFIRTRVVVEASVEHILPPQKHLLLLCRFQSRHGTGKILTQIN